MCKLEFTFIYVIMDFSGLQFHNIYVTCHLSAPFWNVKICNWWNHFWTAQNKTEKSFTHICPVNLHHSHDFVYLTLYIYSVNYKIWQVSNIGDNKIMGLLMRVPLAGRHTLEKERHLYCQKNKHLSIYFVIILLHVWVTLSVPYVFFF